MPEVADTGATANLPAAGPEVPSAAVNLTLVPKVTFASHQALLQNSHREGFTSGIHAVRRVA